MPSKPSQAIHGVNGVRHRHLTHIRPHALVASSCHSTVGSVAPPFLSRPSRRVTWSCNIPHLANVAPAERAGPASLTSIYVSSAGV